MSLWGRVTSNDYWSDVGHDLKSIGSSVANTPTLVVKNLISEPIHELRKPAQDIGQLPLDLTAGLPGTGTNIGMGVGNLGMWGLSGIGAGLGSGLGSTLSGIGGGLGGGLGDIGKGLAKPLLYAVLAVVVLLVVLSFATKGRSVSAGPVNVR